MLRKLKYSIGMYVSVRVGGGHITNYSTDPCETILIAGSCADTAWVAYLALPSKDGHLKGDFIPKPDDIVRFSIPKEYQNQRVVTIDNETLILCVVAANISSRDPKTDGCNCAICKDFYYMAEPNLPDGRMLCFRCKPRAYLLNASSC